MCVWGGSGLNRASFFSFRCCFLGSEGKRQIGVFFSFPLFFFPVDWKRNKWVKEQKTKITMGSEGTSAALLPSFFAHFWSRWRGQKNCFVLFFIGEIAKIGIVRGAYNLFWVVEDKDGSGIYAGEQLTPLFLAEGEVDIKAISLSDQEKIVVTMREIIGRYAVLAHEISE